MYDMKGKIRAALTPAVDEDLRTILSRNGLGVLQRLPRQLREGAAEHHRSTLLLAVTVLLAVGRIPHPVHKEVGNVEKCEEVAVPVVRGGVMVGQVDCAVTVAQRNTSEVPENQHETPFFVVHIPANKSDCDTVANLEEVPTK